MQEVHSWQRPRRDESDRLQIDVHWAATAASSLASDVRAGLVRQPKVLPPKYFYDDLGAVLFEKICETPEYYPTRTEAALLEVASDFIIETAQPTDIVELGSGSSRKTRAILDAAERAFNICRYVPFDVSAAMLRTSSVKLLDAYTWLSIHGVVGDYDLHLRHVPPGDRRLWVFLGGTIGNFEPEEAVGFLRTLRGAMGEYDHLLLGTDLVKDAAILNAAYNDAAGLTAAFNRNVLSVINQELGADFELERFDHEAHFNERHSQIEMHLRARDSHRVRIPALDLQVDFGAGESIRTEISRKFTLSGVRALLGDSGFELIDWYTPTNGFFGLSLARPC